MNLNLLKNIFNKWHVNIITDNITDIQSILKFATCTGIYIQQMSKITLYMYVNFIIKFFNWHLNAKYNPQITAY